MNAAAGEASETAVESMVETVVVVMPYTEELPVLKDGEVATFLGREGVDEDMGRKDSTTSSTTTTTSVVEEMIVNAVFDINGICHNLENTFDLDKFDM